MIAVCGDFHGSWSKVNQFLNSHLKISMILQCGDFGWWPRFHGKTFLNKGVIRWNNYGLKNKHVKVFWCPGNHEDWESLKNLKTNEVSPNVFYMKRGSILTIPDGRKVLFMGGGLSIDRKYRTERGLDFGWFWEETISQKDIEELPDEEIDIIISHTAPTEFKIKDYHEEYSSDPSRKALSYLLNKYKPKLWYFGHMHKFQQGFDNNCKWVCLSAIDFEDRWWIPLED
jgi:Icc-related predicted phosphoesterase